MKAVWLVFNSLCRTVSHLNQTSRTGTCVLRRAGYTTCNQINVTWFCRSTGKSLGQKLKNQTVHFYHRYVMQSFFIEVSRYNRRKIQNAKMIKKSTPMMRRAALHAKKRKIHSCSTYTRSTKSHASISVLRSLTLSDWAFFLEFQQNSRTATRIARANPQTSTTKTPPGNEENRKLIILSPQAVSASFLVLPCARFTVNVAVNQRTHPVPGICPPIYHPLTYRFHPSSPFPRLCIYLFIYPSV